MLFLYYCYLRLLCLCFFVTKGFFDVFSIHGCFVFYIIFSGRVERLVPHFSHELLHPTDNRKKMKVVNSCRILSKTTATALRFYANHKRIDPKKALPLAKVIELLNNWFDLFNGKKGSIGFKGPFTGLFIFMFVFSLFIFVHSTNKVKRLKMSS